MTKKQLLEGLKDLDDDAEIQLKKARQLYYAHEIGFDVTYKDYQRWHLL